MTSFQPQPPVTGNPQPVVVLVNEPTVMDSRQYRFSTSIPYLNRGAQFNNGCRCNFLLMILLITMGAFFFILGISSVRLRGVIGFMMLAMGGTLLGIGIYLVHTAKKQFNSLPPDHPDRTKYAVQSTMSRPVAYQTPTMYTVPPVQNQVTNYPTTSGRQNYLVPNSGMTTQFAPPPGRRSPHSTYRPEDDPPPAYSDVVQNR